MTAPEPTGITDRTVELWTAGQQPGRRHHRLTRRACAVCGTDGDYLARSEDSTPICSLECFERLLADTYFKSGAVKLVDGCSG